MRGSEVGVEKVGGGEDGGVFLGDDGIDVVVLRVGWGLDGNCKGEGGEEGEKDGAGEMHREIVFQKRREV